MTSDPKKQGLNNYARYSGMAFQMLAIILLGMYAGVKLDQWLHLKPLFTIICSLASVILAIYIFTCDLLRKR